MKAATQFADACNDGSCFYLEQEQLKTVREGLYVPVTGQKRLESAVKSLYHSCGYPADVYTALCYSGILDYRSVTGEGRHILILSDESPIYSASFISQCLEISPQKLKDFINQKR